MCHGQPLPLAARASTVCFLAAPPKEQRRVSVFWICAMAGAFAGFLYLLVKQVRRQWRSRKK